MVKLFKTKPLFSLKDAAFTEAKTVSAVYFTSVTSVEKSSMARCEKSMPEGASGTDRSSYFKLIFFRLMLPAVIFIEEVSATVEAVSFGFSSVAFESVSIAISDCSNDRSLNAMTLFLRSIVFG